MSELETATSARAGTPTSVITGDRARAVFGQTMGLVALTTAVAALGAYVGRDLSRGWGFVAMIAAIGCMLGMNVAIRRSQQLAIGLLFGMGALLGVGLGPVLAYYASVNPQSLWQAGGATALFIAGFGAAGYATRRDLSPLYRFLFFALLGLIIFGVVAIFVTIPAASLVYSILGLVIFAGYTLVDFNRLRRSGNVDAAPLFAAAIFLDVLNVFLFFLNLLNR